MLFNVFVLFGVGLLLWEQKIAIAFCLVALLFLSVFGIKVFICIVKRILHIPQKKHLAVRLSRPLVFAAVFFGFSRFYFLKTVYGDKYIDNEQVNWTWAILGSPEDRPKFREKAAENFTEYLKTAPLENYYYKIYANRSHWQDDRIYAWKNENHKIYYVEDMYENSGSEPYRQTQGFWYEKDGCFYGKERLKAEKELKSGNIEVKTLSETAIAQKTAWEELPCESEIQRAREILLYVAQNWQSIKRKKLFDIRCNFLNGDGSCSVVLLPTSGFEENGDREFSAAVGNIVIDEIKGYPNSDVSEFSKKVTLKYTDKEQGRTVEIWWDCGFYDEEGEKKLLSFEEGRLF